MEYQIQKLKEEQLKLRNIKLENLKKQINEIYKQYGERQQTGEEGVKKDLPSGIWGQKMGESLPDS